MKKSYYVKYFILFISIGLIVAGVITGEAGTVLAKATRICLECIGIG